MRTWSAWLILALIFGALGWRGLQYLNRSTPDCPPRHCQTGSARS